MYEDFNNLPTQMIGISPTLGSFCPLSQLPNGTHNGKDHLHEFIEISARRKEREVSLS
jgi:hypothetical protein